MSLSSLVSAYLNPGTLYADSITDGDEVAKTRMQLELCEAIKDEIIPTMTAGTFTTSVWDRVVRVHTAVFPDRVALGPIGVAGGHNITGKDRTRMKKLSDRVTTLTTSLAQIKGQFPTASGVSDSATAIYPGTRIYAVFDGPAGYINQVCSVVSDNGEDPIEVSPIGLVGGLPSYTLERYRVHYEYVPAQTDLATAEYIDGLQVGDTITDGVTSANITIINHADRLITATDIAPSSPPPAALVISFETAMADWTLV